MNRCAGLCGGDAFLWGSARLLPAGQRAGGSELVGFADENAGENGLADMEGFIIQRCIGQSGNVPRSGIRIFIVQAVDIAIMGIAATQ